MKFVVLMEIEGVPGDVFIQLSELYPNARIWMNATDRQPDITAIRTQVMGGANKPRIFAVDIADGVSQLKDQIG